MTDGEEFEWELLWIKPHKRRRPRRKATVTQRDGSEAPQPTPRPRKAPGPKPARAGARSSRYWYAAGGCYLVVGSRRLQLLVPGLRRRERLSSRLRKRLAGLRHRLGGTGMGQLHYRRIWVGHSWCACVRPEQADASRAVHLRPTT